MSDLITVKDALGDNAEQKLTDKRQKLEEHIDNLLKNPRGPERWKAARDLAINLGYSGTPGMSAREENSLVIKDNIKSRETHTNKFAVSDDPNSDLRGVLNMPYYVNMFIRLSDPEAFDKKNVHKLYKAFPEYQVPDSL